MKLITTKTCGPCHEVLQYLEENPMDIEIVDADENPEICIENRIMCVPTLIKDDGKVVIGSKSIIEELEKRGENGI